MIFPLSELADASNLKRKQPQGEKYRAYRRQELISRFLISMIRSVEMTN